MNGSHPGNSIGTKVNPGSPSGVLISLIFHGVLFFLAGVFVVIQILPVEPLPFQLPPRTERPRIKPRKPDVKMQKSSTPKPSSRIVTKVKTAKLPEFQIPDLMGTGAGLRNGTDIGGDFLEAPEFDEPTVMGDPHSIGSDLVGTFYDFKRDRNGGWNRAYTFEQTPEYLLIVNKFIKSGWKGSSLARYYRSPRKLYAPCIVIPPSLSEVAPVAFDPDPDEAAGGAWMVHYKGKLVHKKGIKFRFVCSSDYFIVIRVDGEIVWSGVWNPAVRYEDWSYLVGGLHKLQLNTRRYFYGNDRGMAGDWITLEPNVPKDIDIIIGDENGECGFIVMVEEEGVEYETGPQGNPILPIFKTADLSHSMVDQIYRGLADGMVNVTNGPVFCDYDSRGSGGGAAIVELEPQPESLQEEGRGLRNWKFKTGESLEARYVKDLSDKIMLRDSDGKDWFIAKEQFRFSDADREYLALEQPPELDLEIRKTIQRKNFSMVRGAENRVPEQRASFGVKIKQTSSEDYPYPLTVEVFAVGEELKGTRYILLDRFSSPFRLTERHRSVFEYYSRREVRMTDNWPNSPQYDRYGERYYGFLIVVKDKRGKVVAMDASNKWLETHRRTLETRGIGNYMDKTCRRTYPTRPETYIYATSASRK